MNWRCVPCAQANRSIIFWCESITCRKNLQHDFVLNQVTPFYTLPCCCFKPYCNIILPFTPGFPSSFFFSGFATRTFYVFLHVLCVSVGCYRPLKCYKFLFSAALSTQGRLFHVNRNGEVYAKYCVFTHDIYCVVAVFMGRHVPFDIVISCISRLLDSVFFIIETDYRNTHNL